MSTESSGAFSSWPYKEGVSPDWSKPIEEVRTQRKRVATDSANSANYNVISLLDFGNPRESFYRAKEVANEAGCQRYNTWLNFSRIINGRK